MKHTMRYPLIPTLIFAFLLPGPSFSQTVPGQHPEEFQGTLTREVRMKYLLFIPEGYNTDQKWPLIMYLHGGSRRRTDIEKLREPGYRLSPGVAKDKYVSFIRLS